MSPQCNILMFEPIEVFFPHVAFIKPVCRNVRNQMMVHEHEDEKQNYQTFRSELLSLFISFHEAFLIPS